MCDDNPIDTLSIPTTNNVIESRKIKVKMLMLLLGFFESNLKNEGRLIFRLLGIS
jgi:hypothetical protein